jgi:hypothetical protein
MNLLWLLLGVVGAQPTEPIYAHTLRHLPEKLRQERTLEEVKTRVEQIKQLVLNSAASQTETNFTLFCLEPNDIPYMFESKGSHYRLIEPSNYQGGTPYPLLHPKPKSLLKDGYTLYRRYTPLPYDTPLVSIQLFFHYFNQQFPDLRLSIVNERNANRQTQHGETIFETDCCPLYTVSWKE